jgi:hypothetical protein
MTEEIILSPIKDEKIASHLNDSEIWKKAYKPEEVTDEVRSKYPGWYEYHIRFEGLTPIQLTKFKEI